MTGGALTWTNATWPGAFFERQGVRYVSVAGRAVRGNSEADRRSVPGYAAGSYQQVSAGIARLPGCSLPSLPAEMFGGRAARLALDVRLEAAGPAELLEGPPASLPPVSHAPQPAPLLTTPAAPTPARACRWWARGAAWRATRWCRCRLRCWTARGMWSLTVYITACPG